MSQSILERLEQVANRLEFFTSQLTGGAAVAPVASSSSSSSAAAPAKTEDKPAAPVNSIPHFDNTKSKFKALIESCNKNELPKLAEYTTTSMNTLEKVMKACAACKKPSQEQLMKMIADLVKVVESSSNIDYKSKTFNYEKSYSEAIQSLSWIFVTTPRAFIQDQYEAAEFYLNKILVDAKKESDPKKSDMQGFVTAVKGLLVTMQEMVVNHCKAGLEWNPKGVTLEEFEKQQSSAPAAPAVPAAPSAPAPPCAPPAPAAPLLNLDDAPAAKPTAGGMSAVFASIQGASTSGLKKVTNDMKTKNMKDVPVLEAKKPATTTPAPSTAAVPKAAEKKPPCMELRKGLWAVEYFDNHKEVINIPDSLDVKESVYIFKCKNCVVNISNKCKSITMDGCERVTVTFGKVVSIMEVINCKSCDIEVREQCPSLTIDKCVSVSAILTSTSYVQPPNFITANISECNIVIPGKTESDDPIELPIPQQFQTVIKNGGLHTEILTHGG